MYDLKTFFKDFVGTLKRITTKVVIIFLVVHLQLGWVIWLIAHFSFDQTVFDALTYAIIIPLVILWIPLMWKFWERSDPE